MESQNLITLDKLKWKKRNTINGKMKLKLINGME